MVVMTKELAAKIYDTIAIHLGSDEKGRAYFIERFSREECKEFRIGGSVQNSLVSGLKVRNNDNGIYLDYYQEHKTVKIENTVKKINADLKEIV